MPMKSSPKIGDGGTGEVYRARVTRLDRIVAIKVLAPHAADDAAFRERFDREARAISQLNHLHICTLRDAGARTGRRVSCWSISRARRWRRG